MAAHCYIVSIFNQPFFSLEDAKWNVTVSLTRKEALKFLTYRSEFNNLVCDEAIMHFHGDKLISRTPIKVDEQGNITFGRTRKVV